MDWKKNRGSDKQKKSGKAANLDSAGKIPETIDATPYGEPAVNASTPRQGAANRGGIQDLKIWKDSTSGLRNGWNNYLQMLADYFQGMSRLAQEALITRVCMIVTIGVSLLLTIFFYPFLPLYLRVIAVPLILAAAWWAGTNVVAPVIIVRYEQYLNREF